MAQEKTATEFGPRIDKALEESNLADEYFKITLKSQDHPSLLIDDYILNVVEYIAVDKSSPADEETNATDVDASSTD